MAKKPFTLGELGIIEGARRRVTKLEKVLSRGRFSLGGEYFVSASVRKITASTPYLPVSRVRDYLAGVSHGKATKQRKAGERAYVSAASEAQARAQIRVKARPEKKAARVRKARYAAKRQAAATKEGFERGRRQRDRVIKFLNDAHKRHERYLRTNRDPLEEDEYRKVVHLSYEYFGDDERMDRLKMSYAMLASPNVTVLPRAA
jgi:hypothetical protein